jgi:hypothetical protein
LMPVAGHRHECLETTGERPGGTYFTPLSSNRD